MLPPEQTGQSKNTHAAVFQRREGNRRRRDINDIHCVYLCMLKCPTPLRVTCHCKNTFLTSNGFDNDELLVNSCLQEMRLLNCKKFMKCVV